MTEYSTAEEAQIAELYQEMYPTLLEYAKRVLHEYTLAEEAVQDTFCIACAKSNQLLHSSNPNGWLVITLKNVIQNTRRRQAKAKILKLWTAEDSMWITYNDEDVDMLYGDIAQREDFQLFKRVVLDRCSMREAAQEAGITVDACKKRVQRCRHYLYERFSSK
ncbi:MAG: sigma-70 family RNA polymerase sigma factor [Oscillibacter sp.]|nr:sigma-70 family RNA polymerase sigma factor [Oscillibacter sp.]